MTRTPSSIGLAFLFTVAGCVKPIGSIKTTSGTVDKGGHNKLTYYLPKSKLVVEGKLVTNVVKSCKTGTWASEKEEFELDVRSISVLTLADTSYPYAIEVPTGRRGTILTGVFGMGPQGVLTSSKAVATEQVSTTTLSTVEAVASVAGSAAAALLSTGTGTDPCETLMAKIQSRGEDLEKELKVKNPRKRLSDEIKFLRGEIATLSKAYKAKDTDVRTASFRCEFDVVPGVTTFAINSGATSCSMPQDAFPGFAASRSFDVVLEDAGLPQPSGQPEPKEKKCGGEAAVFFKLPFFSAVEVRDGTRLVARSTPLPFPQLAPTHYLPCGKHYGRSKVSMEVELHSKTGTLKKVNVTLGRDVSKQLEKAGGVLKSAGETVGKELAEDKASKDKALENEVKAGILETCKAALEAGTWSPACEQ